MRTALAMFLLLLGIVPLGAAADPSNPLDTSVPPVGDVFTIEVEREASRTAVKVVPRLDGTVVLTRPDRNVEYIPGSRIRSIRDSSGNDLTSYVLIDRQVLEAGRERRERAPVRYKSLRFRPGPPSECGSYLITESGVTFGKDTYPLIEYGWARNVGRSNSLGITGFVGWKSDLTQEGVRLRLVQWVARDVSLNLSPGLILHATSTNARQEQVQFSGQAGVNVNGRFGLVVEYFQTRLVGNFASEPDVVEADLHVGFRLGAWPGVVATLPTALLGGLLQTVE